MTQRRTVDRKPSVSYFTDEEEEEEVEMDEAAIEGVVEGGEGAVVVKKNGDDDEELEEARGQDNDESKRAFFQTPPKKGLLPHHEPPGHEEEELELRGPPPEDAPPAEWVRSYVRLHSRWGGTTAMTTKRRRSSTITKRGDGLSSSSTTQEEEEEPWYVFDHEAMWRIAWDVGSIVFMAALVVIEPYIAAFQPRGLGIGWGQVKRHEYWVVFLDIAHLTWFSIDMVFQFFTSYASDSGVIVSDPKKIAEHYLKTWFFADLLQTFPWGRILAAAFCSKRCARRGTPVALLHAIPIVRAVKLSKVSKARVMMATSPDVSDVLGLSPVADTIVAFASACFLINHLFACCFFLIGQRTRIKGLDRPCYDGFDYDELRSKQAKCTWLQIKGYSQGAFSNAFLYVTSMYWSVTTLTTVGYGDISANSTSERLFTMLVEVVGVAFFASLVSSLSGDVFSEDDQASETRKLKSGIKLYLAKHRFPPDLALAVTSFLKTQRDFRRAGAQAGHPMLLVSTSDYTSSSAAASDSQNAPGVSQSESASSDNAFVVPPANARDVEVASFLRDALNLPLRRAMALHIARRDASLATHAFFKDRHDNFVADCVMDAASSVWRRPLLKDDILEKLVSRPIFNTPLQKYPRSAVAGPLEVILGRGLHLDAVRLVVRGDLGVVVRTASQQDEGLLPDSGGVPSQTTRTSFTLAVGDFFGHEGKLARASFKAPLCTFGRWAEFVVLPFDDLLDRLLAVHADVKKDLEDHATHRVDAYPDVFAVVTQPPPPVVPDIGSATTATTTATTDGEGEGSLPDATPGAAPRPSPSPSDPATVVDLAARLDRLQADVSALVAAIADQQPK